MESETQSFLKRVKDCQVCTIAKKPLPHAPNPVFQFGPSAPILIAGQAPGNLADKTGTPFNDPSGDRLREWLGVGREEFYNPARFTILPMGFCFPGYTPKGADLPPRKECAREWRKEALTYLSEVKVTLLIGGYAQQWHLDDQYQGSVTKTVACWRDFAPSCFPIPHPSWRNNAWIKRNPWFENELLPALRKSVRVALSEASPLT